MNSPRHHTVAYRYGDAYAAALEALRAAVGAKDNCALIDLCLAREAKRRGLTMPVRANPNGTNQHGTPRAKGRKG